MRTSSTLSSLLFAASRSSVASAWSSPSCRPLVVKHSQLFMSSTAAAASTSTPPAAAGNAVVPLAKPPRVIPENLPVVYVYDHCPFCVRVRVALGFKNVKYTPLFMANDDVQTPTALVGKKIAPILEWKKEDNAANNGDTDGNTICMAESMDIIELLESDESLGPVNLIKPASGRTDLKEWQGSCRDLLRRLQRPRYVATGLLPEFQTLDGRRAFITNHQLPPYGKDEWKTELTEEQRLAAYAEGMAADPAADIEELNRLLVDLNDELLFSEHHCSDTAGVSLDDVDLFSRLRSITIIKNVVWPTKLRRYMDNMAVLSDIPLYDQMAM